MQEYFEIGQIVNTSGLKGLVKVNLFMDDITKIEDFKKILVEKNKECIFWKFFFIITMNLYITIS